MRAKEENSSTREREEKNEGIEHPKQKKIKFGPSFFSRAWFFRYGYQIWPFFLFFSCFSLGFYHSFIFHDFCLDLSVFFLSLLLHLVERVFLVKNAES